MHGSIVADAAPSPRLRPSREPATTKAHTPARPGEFYRACAWHDFGYHNHGWACTPAGWPFFNQ